MVPNVKSIGAIALLTLASSALADVTVYQYPDRPAVVVDPAPVVIERREVVPVPRADVARIPAGPRLTLFDRSSGGVRAVELTSSVEELDSRRFDRRASAALVSEGVWRLCDRERGQGSCADFPPGRYDTLGALDGRVRSAYLVAPAERVVVAPVPAERVVVAPTPVAPEPPIGRAVLYENPNYAGRMAVIDNNRAPDLDWANFKNPATSLKIESGDWLMCSDIGYRGDCRVLGPGNYPMVTGLFNPGISSAREVSRPGYGAVR